MSGDAVTGPKVGGTERRELARALSAVLRELHELAEGPDGDQESLGELLGDHLGVIPADCPS